jgi:hypothetical protein
MACQEDLADSSLPIYGVPRSLFHLLDRVNSLAYQRKTRTDEDAERAFRQTAHSVIEAVEFHINICEVAADDDKADIIYACSAFKWAMRLRLAQILDGYDTSNPDIVNAVHNIIYNTKHVPKTSNVATTLLFPLIMAAGACTEVDRDFLRERLVNMKERSGFGHIYAAHELAERVWLYRDLDLDTTPYIPVNWASIRYHEMHGLAIF